MTVMSVVLTLIAFLLLVAGGAYVIHRLNAAHGERIAEHRYSRLLSGRPAGAAAGPVPPRPGSSSGTGSADRTGRDAAVRGQTERWEDEGGAPRRAPAPAPFSRGSGGP
ncbi:hypothetical protein ACFC5X_09590 [Streptomyces sp. NPDC055952]|uniref:hypothetical protein n=1 Tax=Streptomyces sp. NPDC055952 TaxID=3345663 RepID=UPI0035DD5FBE